MEGSVGSDTFSDRAGGGFSQYDTQVQGRQKKGDCLPKSQAPPSADGDDGGYTLQGFTLYLKIL